ncbi:MAG: hypothetical protein HND57_11380 [Planctomycetes bacterium]|nr:hypothetical protein [Planctomycetota bacterium]
MNDDARTTTARAATLYAAALLCSFFLSACAGPTGEPAKIIARRPSLLQVTGQEAGVDHPLAAYGLPELAAGFTQPPTTLVQRDGWVALHSDLDRIPLWVCQRLDSTDTVGDADRDSCSWHSDPQLGDGPTATDPDYTHSGYARGHMAPANDYSFSQTETCETFFFTNCCPQIQNGFNSGIWSSLEADCQDAAEARGSVFIITGPIFYDPVDDESAAEYDAAYDDDIVEYYVIGTNMVAVPTYYYKIVIDATDEESPSAIGFVLENRRYVKSVDGPRFQAKHTRSIRWIEQRTGLDFMPLLDEVGVDPDDFETAEAVLTDWPEFMP